MQLVLCIVKPYSSCFTKLPVSLSFANWYNQSRKVLLYVKRSHTAQLNFLHIFSFLYIVVYNYNINPLTYGHKLETRNKKPLYSHILLPPTLSLLFLSPSSCAPPSLRVLLFIFPTLLPSPLHPGSLPGGCSGPVVPGLCTWRGRGSWTLPAGALPSRALRAAAGTP